MRRSLLLVGSLALVFSACSSSSSTSSTAKETLKIGYIGPMSGDAAMIGADTLHGAQMAIDEMNAKGGIGGREVELVTQDGKCASAESTIAAQKLIAVAHVVAIIGGVCSSETLAAAPFANIAKVPLISPASSSSDSALAGGYVFRDYPSDAQKATAMVQYIQSQGWKKMAILTTNADVPNGLRKSLLAQLGKDGIAYEQIVQSDDKDLRDVMNNMKTKSFDAFFPNGQNDATVGLMLTQFRDAGFAQPAIASDAVSAAHLVSLTPGGAEGLRTITVANGAIGTSFEKNFIAHYGPPQADLAFAAHAHDATAALLSVIQKVGTKGPAIKDGLLGLKEFPGVLGTFHFDHNGDVVGLPFALNIVTNGKIAKVSNLPLQ